MKKLLSLFLSVLLLQNAFVWLATAQSGAATKSIHPSQSSAPLLNQDVLELQQAKLTSEELIAKIKSSKCEFDVSPAAIELLKGAGVPTEIIATMVQVTGLAPKAETIGSPPFHNPVQLVIPAGTRLDVEASYTVTSMDVRPGELVSFRVLVPVIIDNVIVIDKGALVTGRVVEAKRGGHWGKSGRLSWTMQDVLAVDGTRVPIQIEGDPEKGEGRSAVKGTSHAGEVATRTVVLGVLLAPLFPIAPLALMQGFKRGENAVLSEGKRLVVFVHEAASIKVAADQIRD